MKKLTFILAAAVALSANAYSIKGTVVEVLDGDTIKIQSGNTVEKVRLAYIDAPELKQKFGTVSKNSLTMLTKSKPAVAECGGKDKYGRNLCVVTVDNSVVNITQVTRGLAWAYTYYIPKDSPFIRMQEAAKKDKLGLWADSKPQAPWDFRRAQ